MAGSLALRLKEDNLCRRVVALVRRQTAAVEAQEQEVVDWATTDAEAALAEADIVIFATPVRILLQQLMDYAAFFKPGAIITDMGSTKQTISQVLASLPEAVYPIGSHPMCGKEIGGLSAADSQLYEGATWVISPLDRTPAGVIHLVQNLAHLIGAKPLILEPERHDKLVAAISHMPYVLSSALVLAAQEIAHEDALTWQVAASGFRDTSRIAASQVDMMLDILLANREAVGDMLARLSGQLDAFATAIAEGDEVRLRAMMEQGRAQRRALYK